jgi:hypothetical protein
MSTRHLDDGGSKHLWNVGQFISDYRRWLLFAFMTETVNISEMSANLYHTTYDEYSSPWWQRQ